MKGLKFLKHHYYCDCYISQIKVFLSNDDKYNIISEYVIEDDEPDEEDKDILDEEIISEMLKQKELEKKKEGDKKILQEEILKLQQELNNL